MSLRRVAAAALLVLYVLVVAAIVFAPSAEVPTESVSWIWAVLQGWGFPAWVSPSVVEFATNVVLFVPLSLLGAAFRPAWGWAHWFAAGLACTLLIEVGQLALLPGRSADLVDVAANALGALLGYLLASLVRQSRAGRGGR